MNSRGKFLMKRFRPTVRPGLRWRNKPYHGRPAKAEYMGASTGSCGNTIRIFLHSENDRVRDAGFGTDGCGSSQISGSMAIRRLLVSEAQAELG
jgi:NifU-like protein involved in Fe-S cluster formation